MTVIELITTIRQHKKASLAILVLACVGKNCIGMDIVKPVGIFIKRYGFQLAFLMFI